MCGYACVLCVWQESQECAVFRGDTSRTTGSKSWRARVGDRHV